MTGNDLPFPQASANALARATVSFDVCNAAMSSTSFWSVKGVHQFEIFMLSRGLKEYRLSGMNERSGNSMFGARSPTASDRSWTQEVGPVTLIQIMISD